jgi:uncharacterized protein YicC (UPF0701 family)
LNSKSLDLNLKFVGPYKELESEIRKIVAEQLDRGKIDVGVYLESAGSIEAGTINKELAAHYFHELKSLNEEIGNQHADYLSLVLRMPDVISNQTIEITEEEKMWVLDLVGKTCSALTTFRQQEGAVLNQDLIDRITAIKRCLQEIPQYESERIITVKERIQK